MANQSNKDLVREGHPGEKGGTGVASSRAVQPGQPAGVTRDPNPTLQSDPENPRNTPAERQEAGEAQAKRQKSEEDASRERRDTERARTGNPAAVDPMSHDGGEDGMRRGGDGVHKTHNPAAGVDTDSRTERATPRPTPLVAKPADGWPANATDLPPPAQEIDNPAGEAEVEFISKDPGLNIELGDRQVQFNLHRVRVPASIGERLKRHIHYQNNKIWSADEVAILGGDVISYRDNASFQAHMAEARTGAKVMFATKINDTLSVDLGAGTEVRFNNGYAAVTPDIADRLRRHMFFREGRILELQPA